MEANELSRSKGQVVTDDPEACLPLVTEAKRVGEMLYHPQGVF